MMERGKCTWAEAWEVICQTWCFCYGSDIYGCQWNLILAFVDDFTADRSSRMSTALFCVLTFSLFFVPNIWKLEIYCGNSEWEKMEVGLKLDQSTVHFFRLLITLLMTHSNIKTQLWTCIFISEMWRDLSFYSVCQFQLEIADTALYLSSLWLQRGRGNMT